MTVTRISLALAAGIALALPVSAETALPPNTFIAAEAPVQYLAKDRLIGAKVKGPDGKIIGDIEDIILSGDHQVVGVVMGTGGFFGLFEKKVGVEVGAIQFDVVDGKIGATLVTATKDVLEAAPAFVRDHAKKSIFERAVEKTQEIRDKTGTSAKDVYEDVKDKAAPAVEKAKEKAKEALDNAGPAVQKAKEAVKEAIESAKEKAKDVVDKAKDAAQPADTAPAPAPVEPAAPEKAAEPPAAEKAAEPAPAPAAEKPAEPPAPAPAEPAPAPAAAEKAPEPAPAPAAEKPAEPAPAPAVETPAVETPAAPADAAPAAPADAAPAAPADAAPAAPADAAPVPNQPLKRRSSNRVAPLTADYNPAAKMRRGFFVSTSSEGAEPPPCCQDGLELLPAILVL